MTLRHDFLAFTAGAVASRTVLPAVARADIRPANGTDSVRSSPAGSPTQTLTSSASATLSPMRNWRTGGDTEGLADAQDTPSDAETMQLIEATPATTLEGLRAKGLASAAWNRDMASDSLSLVTTLLRDQAEPEFSQILARPETEYGPLPTDYVGEGGLLA